MSSKREDTSELESKICSESEKETSNQIYKPKRTSRLSWDENLDSILSYNNDSLTSSSTKNEEKKIFFKLRKFMRPTVKKQRRFSEEREKLGKNLYKPIPEERKYKSVTNLEKESIKSCWFCSCSELLHILLDNEDDPDIVALEKKIKEKKELLKTQDKSQCEQYPDLNKKKNISQFYDYSKDDIEHKCKRDDDNSDTIFEIPSLMDDSMWEKRRSLPYGRNSFIKPKEKKVKSLLCWLKKES